MVVAPAVSHSLLQMAFSLLIFCIFDVLTSYHQFLKIKAKDLLAIYCCRDKMK
jgi:hypothetical protein